METQEQELSDAVKPAEVQEPGQPVSVEAKAEQTEKVTQVVIEKNPVPRVTGYGTGYNLDEDDGEGNSVVTPMGIARF